MLEDQRGGRLELNGYRKPDDIAQLPIPPIAEAFPQARFPWIAATRFPVKAPDRTAPGSAAHTPCRAIRDQADGRDFPCRQSLHSIRIRF